MAAGKYNQVDSKGNSVIGGVPYDANGRPVQNPGYQQGKALTGAYAGTLLDPKSQTSAPAPVSTSSGPQIPILSSVLDKNGVLADKYKLNPPAGINASTVNAGQLDINALKADPAALNALKERAMAPGASPWLALQLQQLGLDTTAAKDTAANSALGGAAAARSALAMKGGLSGGARERIATSMGRDINANRQAINRGAANSRVGLNVADDAQKTALLAQIPGMDVNFANQAADLNKYNITTKLNADTVNAAAAQDAAKYNTGMQFDANKLNTQNSLLGVNADNTNNMGIYQQQMQGYAAGKQGDAIANGGKKGVLGTGIGAK